jgi:4-hydroxybenzoate polyprenyltransferase
VALSRPPGVLSASAALLECMRPAQWIKNGFVLAPLLFSARIGDPVMVLRALTALGAFCLSASGIYLWNDSLDWKSDLNHPRKCSRPIPSGRLSPVLATIWGAILMALSMAAAFALNRPTGLLVSGYIVVNSLYSLRLKHVMILDLMCIALGFVFRVMAGASAIQVEPSHWLLMCTFLLALFLGIAKRRQEIVTLAGGSEKHRRVLVNYSLGWLDQAGTLVSGATVVAYALYTVSPETQARFGTDRLIYTLPFVVYGILRYLYLIHGGQSTDNPTGALIADKQLLFCVVLWVFACFVIIYS